MKPCNNVPFKITTCCDIMDCINIESSDNSISVEKDECGVDLKFLPNNLDNILQINEGDCITWIKEFIDGKLHLTPVLDENCLAAKICDICNPPTCPAPIELVVTLV